MKPLRPKPSGNLLLCANCRRRDTESNPINVKWWNDFQEFLCDQCVTEYARDALAQEEAQV